MPFLRIVMVVACMVRCVRLVCSAVRMRARCSPRCATNQRPIPRLRGRIRRAVAMRFGSGSQLKGLVPRSDKGLVYWVGRRPLSHYPKSGSMNVWTQLPQACAVTHVYFVSRDYFWHQRWSRFVVLITKTIDVSSFDDEHWKPRQPWL